MKYIIRVLTYLLQSFTTENGGASARKLTAFAAVLVAIYITYHYTDKDNVITMVIIWLSTGMLCLGLVTFAQLIQLKNGNNGNTEKQQ